MRHFRPLFFIILSSLILFSCKKDHRVLSAGVQPENDGVETRPAEQYPVFAHIIRHDSVPSLNDNFKFLGINADGNYGTTNIGLYLNANMTSNVSFPKAAKLTSAKIVLMSAGKDQYQGNAGSQLTYSVFVVDSVLDNRRSYFTTNSRLHSQQIIGHTTTTMSPSEGAALTLTLDPSYGTSILRHAESLDNEGFQAAFKGFYIKSAVSSGEGAIFRYDLDNSRGGLFLYYQDTITQKADSFQFTFSGSKSLKFNTMDFAPGPMVLSQWNGDTAQGTQHLYVRGMGVARLKVQIPFLKSQNDSFSYSVNRAEVVFRVPSPPSSGYYTLPPFLSLLAIDSLGREILTIDQRTATDVSRYDGRESELQYKFNIPLHAQAILNGERKNLGFYLVVADPVPPRTARRDNSIDRVELGGSATASAPVLNISYTRLRRD